MLTQQMSETLSIVGAGRVGKALGRYLHDLGWHVGVVVTRSIPTAREAVRAIGGGHATVGLTRQVLASDIVLMATPDSVISEVAAELGISVNAVLIAKSRVLKRLRQKIEGLVD